MKRLPKGYGSVCKLSGNRRNPYAVRISQGLNPDGKPNNKYIGYYPTRKEALNALFEYNKNPYTIEAANITLNDIWNIFKERRFPAISQSGKKVYTAAYKHLSPLHDIFIKDIKTYNMQALIDGINRSWQTKSHVQTLLHQLFNIAIELDIVSKNYAEFIKLPPKPTSTIHTMFTPEEINTLFSNVFAYPWADTVLIMIYSGMRPSELLNIKISDINLNEKYIIGGLKTTAGKNRVIPISDKVLPFILKRYNSNNTYLIEENQKPVPYSKYKVYFANLMQALGFSHLPHDCRHTFASMANSKGLNEVAVKMIMGHAQKDITDKVYTHKAIAELLSAVNLL